ncbi:hypothetical protein [Croceicoccus naphthovorans]|uniref:hypothetical protein n=1 Tax=Croceicoccus naphthovorans TaxID=1348774 RepID=UPI000AFAFF80|nr:hypothetical protein [Croceicoccus naphthovorans]MBB3989226.1 hypothetical protein [Croceicoccus naphthovorans]
MSRKTAIAWGAAVIGVALLDIFAVLPSGSTQAAVLTLPALAVVSGNCLRRAAA